MQTANDKRIGDQVITDDLRFTGTVDGSVHLRLPGRLDLVGEVSGDVTVEDGATLIVRGAVRGAVHIRGGIVEIWGTVGSTNGTPWPFVAPGARVEDQG